MATEAQVRANRSNAEKSTGPRTAEGKAAVSQNAVRHGLSGRVDVIKGEDQAEFERHREAVLAELAPVGAVESMLVERVVSLSWRLKRVERMQNEVFDALLADGATPLAKLARSLVPGGAEDDGELALGRAAIKDFSNSRVLDRLLMYERRMEHSLLKTLNDLHLRRLRVREYISQHMDEIGAEPGGSVPVRTSWRGGEGGGAGRAEPTSPVRGAAFPSRRTPDGVTTNAPGEADADTLSATWTAHPGDIPSFRDRTDGADGPVAAEPSCKTKPISPRTDDGQIPSDEGVTENLAADGQEETNPIWAGSEAELDTVRPAAEEVMLGEPRLDAAGKTR